MVNQYSVIFPLPLPLHIGFIVISLIVLGIHFKIRKEKYQLYLMLGILSTLLIYIDHSSWFIALLGLEEIVLFVLAMISMHKYTKKREAEEEAAEAENRSEKTEEKPDESGNS